MPKEISQSNIETPAPSDLVSLELKANLNSEQRAYLEVLKDKMKKNLGNKTKQELAKAGDLETLKNYKAVLTEILDFLRTKEKSLEHKFELKKQYDQQFEVLKETGVIKELSDDSWGMLDILGQEQQIPSYEEIKVRMEAKAEMLDKKRKQGFTQLLLLPFGMDLVKLKECAAKLIAKKYHEDKLFDSKGEKLLKFFSNPDDRVSLHRCFIFADKEGNMVYYPTEFDKNKHGGKNKKEVIAKNGGWQIQLVEDMPELPTTFTNIKKAGRLPFKSGLRPEEYLKEIQADLQYEGEKFFIPELELIYLIQYLHENDRMIDCTATSWNLGAFFKGSKFENLTGFPVCNWWDRNFNLGLSQAPFDGKYGVGHSVRTSVKF